MVPAVGQGFGDPSKGALGARERCPGDNSVWVTVDGAGDCIRYYAAGLTSSNPRAVFYIHGDVMWSPDNVTSPGYAAATVATRQAMAAAAARDIGVPVVMIARPALYGSSGDHRQRRRNRELKLVEQAMQAIRSRYAIETVGITGQSGGGSVAAYLAAHTPDAPCVVFTSSALSLAALRRAGQSDGYDYGATDIYDPIRHLDEVAGVAGRRVFIIGDPNDRYALIGNQIAYFEIARSAGVDAVLIETEADGHHSLDRTGWNVAGWCLSGLPTVEIVRRITSGVVRD